MSETGNPESARPKVRWWLAGLLTVAGIVVIALGYGFAHGWLVGGETDSGYSSGVAVNIGTSLLLAAVLVLFERALVVTAERAAERAAIPIRAEAAAARAESQSVREENAALVQRTAVLEARLLDLDDQLRARMSEGQRQQAQNFASLGETVDRQTVLDILDSASQINALGLHPETRRSGRVTVPAGDGLAAPRVAIEYAKFDEENWNMSEIPTLRLSVIGLEDEPVVWDEDDDPVQVFAEIKQMMIRRGQAKGSGPLSPTTFFQNMRTTVEEAVRSRSGDSAGWLTATPVFEMVADDWMITEGGVEVRQYGIVIRPDLYPHDVPGSERSGYRVGPAPDHLEEAIWNYAAERGVGYFTGPTASAPWGSYSDETPF